MLHARMARLPRIDVVGVPQHIVVRGVDRQPCFFERSDYALFLEIVREAVLHCAAAVHAYVLMTNHLHLLVTGTRPGALSAMVQRVGLRYVRRINARYARTGTLFEGRFRSSRVLGDDRFQRRIAAMLGRSVHIAPPGRPWPAREPPSARSPQPVPARSNSGLPVTDG